jgi:hypothetical protein
MTDSEQLMVVSSALLPEDAPEVDQKGLDRYDYLMLNHGTFDDRQEFHGLMDLIMDGRIQEGLRLCVNFSDFYKRMGKSCERPIVLHLTTSAARV